MATTDEDFTLVASSADGFALDHPIVAGRVAPKRMLDAPGARIMQLAFDDGVELREHKAQVPILIQGLSGVVTVSVGDEEMVLEPGGIVHVAAHVPHAVIAHAGQARILVVMLR